MNAIEYLEAAKTEEVAAELEAQGYNVTTHPQGLDEGFDILATKDGITIAYEIKARPALRDSAQELQRLRELATIRGYKGFRLVVVNPPSEKKIEIEGFESLLAEYIITHIRIPQLPIPYFITGVSDVDILSTAVTNKGIRVIGSGSIDITLHMDGKEERSDDAWVTDAPFRFNVQLSHDLRIMEDTDIRIDPSGLYD